MLQNRAVVIREPDGTLRTANPDERQRILQVYFPEKGKLHNMPKMFEAEHLEVYISVEYS